VNAAAGRLTTAFLRRFEPFYVEAGNQIANLSGHYCSTMVNNPLMALSVWQRWESRPH
jgi:hypothetical protein